MARLEKSAAEIEAEIARIARSQAGIESAWHDGVGFAAGFRRATPEASCNWQLIVMPPISEKLWRALDRAAGDVQSKWDLKITFPGARTLAARARSWTQTRQS